MLGFHIKNKKMALLLLALVLGLLGAGIFIILTFNRI